MEIYYNMSNLFTRPHQVIMLHQSLALVSLAAKDITARSLKSSWVVTRCRVATYGSSQHNREGRHSASSQGNHGLDLPQ